MVYQISEKNQILIALFGIVVLCAGKLFKDYLNRGGYIEGFTFTTETQPVPLKRSSSEDVKVTVYLIITLGKDLATGQKIEVAWKATDSALNDNNIVFSTDPAKYVASLESEIGGTKTPFTKPSSVRRSIASLHSQGAQIALFPEMVITGYPVEDLALRPAFRRASIEAVEALARELAADDFGEILVAIGFLDDDGRPLNSLALIHGGKVAARYVKRHLPNYGVFDEFRNFAPGDKSMVIRFGGIDIGVAICEDIWRDEGPMAELAKRKPGLLLVPNGSPYERSKDDLRFELLKRRARQINAPLVYVNMVGGQDDLVFDGDSIVVEHEFDFSFSGLKTAVSRYLQSTPDYVRADVSASFQEAVVDVLLQKSIKACKETGIDSLVIAGGVAANSRLRAVATERCSSAGIKLRTPPPALCTDNGAMVAALGSLAISSGRPASALGIETASSISPSIPIWA